MNECQETKINRARLLYVQGLDKKKLICGIGLIVTEHTFHAIILSINYKSDFNHTLKRSSNEEKLKPSD